MAVAFRAAGTIADHATSGTVAVPYPAGIAAGDLLVIAGEHESARTMNLPSGWTRLFGPVNASGGGGAMEFFYKVATGSESGTLTVTLNLAGQISAIMSAFSGVDTAAPVDVSATATTPTSGSSVSAPSVTTTKANTLLLHLFWLWMGASPSMTPPAGDTERYDTPSTQTSYLYGLSTVTKAAAGATGTAAPTLSAGMFGGLTATVALAPLTVTTPVADFTGTPLTGIAPLSVAFTDTSTNTPTSWDWDWGDSTTHGTTQNPSHSYTAPGTYTVVLVATNSAGSNTKTRTGYVTVSSAFVPQIAIVI
jgi:hypothetical protein